LLCFVSLISCFTFLAASTVAQERRSGEDFGGIAFKVAPPVGTFGNDFNIGWGISAMNEYVIFKNWSISFDITYLRWGAKPNELIDNFTMIAFTAAPKVYVWSDVYVSLEVGGFYGTTEAKRGPRFEERYQFGVCLLLAITKVCGISPLSMRWCAIEIGSICVQDSISLIFS
jgi:hypothetical protein